MQDKFTMLIFFQVFSRVFICNIGTFFFLSTFLVNMNSWLYIFPTTVHLGGRLCLKSNFYDCSFSAPDWLKTISTYLCSSYYGTVCCLLGLIIDVSSLICLFSERNGAADMAIWLRSSLDRCEVSAVFGAFFSPSPLLFICEQRVPGCPYLTRY